MKIKVGVISDTHGLLRPEVLEILKTCDYIVHGGDINKPAVLDALRELAPLYVVRGNNDKEWAASLPESLAFSIGDVRFFLVHNKKDIPKGLADVRVIVFGHSHKYLEQWEDGCLRLNPGSCGRRRFDQEITMAILWIEGAGIQVEKMVI